MSLAPGTTLGPYEVVSFVGAGGMGEVYRARDARLERDVALKVLSPRLASDPEALGRFIREARTLSQLSHPNVCTLYDAGQDGATHFIVMEFLEGRTLAAQLARGQLAIDQAVEYALQIADGLSKAHAIGVIHRDLKPANVMLTTDGFVKILDFGLSKNLDTGGSVNTTLVTAGSGPVVGTIAYMAPEQTEGARADVRSDIFSFGVMLYEMLTGVRPFDGANVVSTIRRINDATPRPPHEMRPDIPPALAAVIAKALEKDPTHRFQSVPELRAQLRSGAMRSPVPGEQPLSTTDTAAAPRRQIAAQRIWRYAAIAVVALAAIAAAGIWSGNRGPSIKPNDAIAAAAPAPAIAAEELTQTARRGQALLQRYDRPKNVDQAIELFREVIGHDDSNALAHAGMAEAYLRKDGITPDPKWQKLAAESARRAVELNGDLAVAHLAVAMVALREGRRDDALRALERARDLEPRNVDGLRYFGEYYRTTDPARAEELYRAAVAAAPDDWRSHFALGLFYYRSANYNSAISAWEQARKLSPDNMVVFANLGGVYHAVDRTDDAATVFQRALEIEPRSSIYNNLATMRFFQGRLADAAAAFEKAIELSPGYSLYWGNLGDTYRWMPGKEAKAREAFTTAITLGEEGLRANPADVDLRSRVAGYLAKRGDIQQALEQVREIENVKRSPAVYYKTAVVYEIAGRRDAALRDLEVAMKGGYSMREIANEAEFRKLRADARYQRLLAASQLPAPAAK
jgi:eukaryotic-like serine/threonine-protein kinase